ncbi:Translation inhibition and nonsense-mediated decay, variant 2 [Balamuthia mandrillaris]
MQKQASHNAKPAVQRRRRRKPRPELHGKNSPVVLEELDTTSSPPSSTRGRGRGKPARNSGRPHNTAAPASTQQVIAPDAINQTGSDRRASRRLSLGNKQKEEKEQRALGQCPTAEDVGSSTFRHSNKFNAGEVVLVPRSRGGFTYGKVVGHSVVKHCYLDANAKDVHHHQYRVAYPNCNIRGKANLYKDLPNICLGKLLTQASAAQTERRLSILKKSEEPQPVVTTVSKDDTSAARKSARSTHPQTTTAAAMEGLQDLGEDESDEMEEETILWSGVHYQQPENDSTTSPRSAEAATNAENNDNNGKAAFVLDETPTELAKSGPQHLDQNNELPQLPTGGGQSHNVGAPAMFKDVNNAVFSVHNTFVKDEQVLVPRSAGGFTYGQILGPFESNCPLGGAHKHPSWRVLVDLDKQNTRIIKDLLSTNVGKLPFLTLLGDSLVMSLPAKPQHQTTASTTSMSPAPQPLSPAPQLLSPEELEAAKKRIQEQEEEHIRWLVMERERLQRQKLLQHQQRQVESLMDCQPSTKTASTNGDPNTGSATTPSLVPLNAQSSPISPFVADNPKAQEVSPSGCLGAGILPVAPTDSIQVTRNQQPSGQASKQRRQRSRKKRKKIMVVLDGPNIAVRHGRQKEFSVKGIKLAIDYYKQRGHFVVAFLPQHYLTRKPGQGAIKLVEFLPMANDLPLLQKLVDDGFVVLTPPQVCHLPSSTLILHPTFLNHTTACL